MVKDKFRTSAVSVAEGGKNVIISEAHTFEGVTESIAMQLHIDYNSRTVSAVPVGNNWVNMNNYMLTADGVERIKKQTAILQKVADLIEEGLTKLVVTTPQVEA